MKVHKGRISCGTLTCRAFLEGPKVSTWQGRVAERAGRDSCGRQLPQIICDINARSATLGNTHERKRAVEAHKREHSLGLHGDRTRGAASHLQLLASE